MELIHAIDLGQRGLYLYICRATCQRGTQSCGGEAFRVILFQASQSYSERSYVTQNYHTCYQTEPDHTNDPDTIHDSRDNGSG